jgi:hypothetical protein
MTDVFIISSIGALGLLYGVSRLRYSLKSKKPSIVPRKASIVPRKASIVSRKASIVPRKASIVSRKASIVSRKASQKPVNPFQEIQSNMDSKLLYTTGELELEDINYYKPEIIVLDNPKVIEIDYEFSGEKTIQVYWKNYSKVKTYSDLYCYGIKLKKDKILNIIVVHLTGELLGDERLLLTASLDKCYRGLEIKKNEDIMVMGLKNKNNPFFIRDSVLYLKTNVYSNTIFKSINTDSNGVTMINYMLDDYIMFHKEWVIPQKKYIDLITKFNSVGYDMEYDKKRDLYRIDEYGLKLIDNYIQIQKGNKKWIMVKIDDIIKSNIKVESKQVLVKENKNYFLQTDYKGDNPTYNLPIHK